MGAVSHIGQIHITVDNLPGAIAFYRDTLRLDFLFDVPGQDMAFFQVGETRLYLGRSSSPEFRSRPILYLSVKGIEEETSRLKALGVDFISDPTPAHRDTEGTLWLAFFKTPEGIPTALMEVKA